MPLRDCENCPLRARKEKFFCPPKGPDEARIAFVGEAPGAQEAIRKAPFVGESGQILRSTLRQLGVNPDTVYFTNAVKCRPKENATPTVKMLSCCSGTLWPEFKKHGVSIVVALGAIATRALVGEPSIHKAHGNVYKVNGVKVIPTFHPAAVLRDAELFYDFCEDIEYALSDPTDEKVSPSDDFAVLDSAASAVSLFQSMAPGDLWAYDIETANLKVVDNNLLCVALSHREGNHISTYVLPAAVAYDRSVIGAWQEANARGVRWVTHNGSFDAVRVGAQLGFIPTVCDDTLLLHYCLDERQGVQGLKYLAQRYLHAEDWEGDLARNLKEVEARQRAQGGKKRSAPKREKPAERLQRKIAMLDPEVVYKYNANDAIWTLRLYEHYKPVVSSDKDTDRLYTSLLIPAANALARASLHGALVDEKRRQELEQQEIEKAKALAEELRTLLKDPNFNPNSSQQVSKVLYQRFDTPGPRHLRPLPTDEVTKGGSVKDLKEDSTSKVVLQRLARWSEYEAHEFAKLMLAYRSAQKTATTYYQGFKPESDGRVHTSFNIHGTVTGRLSSSDPNLQNLTAEGPVRSIIIAPPGHVLVAADYSQAEVRTMGTLANSKRLYEVFSSGIDVHNTVGKAIYGDAYNPKTHRRMAKAAVFGTGYRMGTASIAETFGVSLGEAERIQNIIYDFLQVEEWMAEQDRSVFEKGYVCTPTGRKRRFPLLTEQNTAAILRQAVNAPIQATASDVLLFALILVDKWIGSLGGHILFPVHDSLVVEVPIENAVEVARRMKRDMLDAPKYVFGPEHIPFDCEFEWGFRYDKGSMREFDPFKTETLDI